MLFHVSFIDQTDNYYLVDPLLLLFHPYGIKVNKTILYLKRKEIFVREKVSHNYKWLVDVSECCILYYTPLIPQNFLYWVRLKYKCIHLYDNLPLLIFRL